MSQQDLLLTAESAHPKYQRWLSCDVSMWATTTAVGSTRRSSCLRKVRGRWNEVLLERCRVSNAHSSVMCHLPSPAVVSPHAFSMCICACMRQRPPKQIPLTPARLRVVRVVAHRPIVHVSPCLRSVIDFHPIPLLLNCLPRLDGLPMKNSYSSGWLT